MTGGSLTAGGSGVNLTVTGSTAVSGASLVATGGATLSLPGLGTYTQPAPATTTLEANGSGSVLSLAGLASITASGQNSKTNIRALSGGDVELPAVTQLAASQSTGAVTVTSTNAGSKVDLAGLTTFNGGSLSVTSQGTVQATELTTFSSVAVTLDSTGTLPIAQWTTLTEGSVTITAGSTTFAGLTDIDGSSLLAQAGASLILPQVTTYTAANGFANPTLEATGAGSQLSLSKLTSISPTGQIAKVNIEAISGGDVEMPAVTQFTTGQNATGVEVTSTNAGSTINLASLTSWSGGSLSVTSQGTVEAADLTTLNDVAVTLDPTATLPAAQWTTLSNSNLTFAAGSYSFAGLTDFDGSIIVAQSGVSVTFPEVASYQSATESKTITVEASGSGSLLSFPALTSIADTGLGSTATFEALSGGDVELPMLASVSSSVILTAVSGSLDLDGATVTMPPPGTGSVINVPAVAPALPFSLGTTGTRTGATFNIASGDVVSLRSGTFAGGTFNVAPGATLDLTGGQSVNYSGTLTGSGGGTLALAAGTVVVGLGGLSLNFPGNMFQWTGGSMNLASGDVTNLGTIDLSGSNETQIFNDGTLFDYGSMIESGTGNFGLHSGSAGPSTLFIDPAGSYLISSDAGINNLFGTNVIDNASTLRKTGGAGASSVSIVGQIENTGTIEADSGSLKLSGTMAQVSNNSLTGGTWNAEAGATLAFPTGTAITSSAANITVDGAGATIAGISGLASSSGNFALTGGASFTTAGDFSNTGTLTLGAGSKLTVSGNYTQGPSATLGIGIGGSVASGDFGQLAITGTATLAGTVSTTFPNGFFPIGGDSYAVATYASETGGSGLAFTGLGVGSSAFLQPVVSACSIDLNTTTTAADLVAQPFQVEASGTAGQSLPIDYQVENPSGNAAPGTWYDSFFLSTTTSLNASAIALGTVEHDGGLAAQGQYSGSLNATIPGVTPGQYYVIAEIDSRGLVPDSNRANNIIAASNPIDVSVPGATLGQSTQGTIDQGQAVYYVLTVPAGEDIAIDASFAAPAGGELYVGYQSVPTPSSFLASSTSPAQTIQQVVIPDTQAGTYYILVEGDTGSAGGQPFTFSTRTLPLAVTGVSPAQAGNGGSTTVTIQGAQFAAGATVSLVPHGGGAAIAGSGITFQGSTALFAQFNLAGAAPGTYDVVVSSGGQHATDSAALTVTGSAAPGHISANLSVPSIVRPGRITYATLSYTNDGGSDAPAPLLVVTITTGNAVIGLPGQTSFTGSSVELLGIATSGPAGTLSPGYQVTLEIPFESTTLVQNGAINFQLQVITVSSNPVDWSALASSLNPPGISSAVWPTVLANLVTNLGGTSGSFLSYMDHIATYLSGLGEYDDDLRGLFGFALSIANDQIIDAPIDSVTDAAFPVPGAIPLTFARQFNDSLSNRETMGPFGLGWTDN
jgi:hypothetical protein